MAIAFYDYDIYLKPSKIMLNLELMKIASYYNKRGDATYLISDLSTIGEFDHIYVFRNVMPKRTIKKEVERIEGENVTHIGLAFTGGIYVPLENQFEKEVAWPNIYWSYFRKKINEEKLTLGMLEKYLNSHYLRLRAGQNFLKLDGLEKKEKVFIYDAEIERVPDWELKLDFCSQITKEKRIHMVNKLHFYTPEDLIKFSKIKGCNSDDVKLIYSCGYNEFKEIVEQMKGWCSPRNGIHYEFGNLKNPASLNEAVVDLILSINKFLLARSVKIAVIFDVSDISSTSEINRLQKAFQYWTDIRVGDESLKQYFKKRMLKDFDEIYGLVMKTPYAQQFESLCNITKNDIKSKGWYYRG